MGLVFAITAGAGGGLGGAPAPLLPGALLLGAAAGAGGSLLDSLLGATVQYSGLDEKTGKVYNRPAPKGARKLTRIAGSNLLSNGAVNFLSAAVTALVALAVTATRLGVSVAAL
jgi:uncharacterized membrane protein